MPGTQHIMMRYDRHSEWICMQRGALLAAYCNDVLVGAIAVRLERQPSGEVQLYIITLGVLAAYRNYGVGGAFLLRRHAPFHRHVFMVWWLSCGQTTPATCFSRLAAASD